MTPEQEALVREAGEMLMALYGDPPPSTNDELAICQSLEMELRRCGFQGPEAELLGAAPRLIRGLRAIVLELT